MFDNATISRRDFIRNSAMVGAGVAAASVLGGCAAEAETSADTATWDKEADVVIIGGGGGGLAAAIEAAKAGASVLILEKGEATGGSTALCGGIIQAAGTTYQKEMTAFQDDTPEKHYQTMLIQGEGLVDESLIRVIADNAPGNIDWLAGLGVTYSAMYGHCHVPYLDDAGVDADRLHVIDGAGAALAAALLAEAEKAGAVVEVATEVTKLVTDGENGVIGVEATSGSGAIRVKANKGVVVAAGGIDRNEELAKAINFQQYWAITTQTTYVALTNTGDGIRMGMEIGAALAGSGGTIDVDLFTGQGIGNNVAQLACVYVNGQGKRFVCEDSTYAYLGRAIYQQTMQHQKQCYMILDSTPVPEGAMFNLAAGLEAGLVVQAATLEELAAKIEVPADNLVATLAQWNENIAKYGQDVDYRRNTQLVPLATAPYYAYKYVANNLGSHGGLKIDTECRVIDLAGNPIPHLFAAGIGSGGWLGPYYPGSGTAIMATMHTGRTAGISAASA